MRGQTMSPLSHHLSSAGTVIPVVWSVNSWEIYLACSMLDFLHQPVVYLISSALLRYVKAAGAHSFTRGGWGMGGDVIVLDVAENYIVYNSRPGGDHISGLTRFFFIPNNVKRAVGSMTLNSKTTTNLYWQQINELNMVLDLPMFTVRLNLLTL